VQVVGIAALCSLLAVGTAVGIRLLLVARRTRRAPELAIGLGLLCITVLGTPLSATGRLPGLVGTPTGDILFGVGLAVALLGIELVWLFTWLVFRRDAAWAKALVGLAALALAAEGIGLMTASSRGSTMDEILPHTRPWAIAIVATVAAAFAWSAMESLRYHARLRRRLALGLADPVVVDRFALWTLSGLATVGVCTGIVGSMLAGFAPLRDAVPLVAIAAAGLTASISWYLAFLPPAAYLGWVRRRSA
jgi:hypothetical protein